MTDDLRVERDGALVHVTFDRPHRHNAFTSDMYDALRELTDRLADDTSTRVVVFSGAGGRAFAAGNDIADFQGRSAADIVDYEARIREVLVAVGDLPQVTVAAIDGACVGGGLALATFCDLRVATRSSRFGYPIARTLGNALSARLLAQTVAVFGDSVTRQMLLTSRLVPAERADQVGALLAVVEDREALEREVETIVEGLMLASSTTLVTTKRQLADLGARAVDEEQDAARLAQVYGSPGFAEGVRAFVAKERPAFGQFGGAADG